MSENISGHLIYFIPLRCKIFAAYKNIRPLLYAKGRWYKDGAKL